MKTKKAQIILLAAFCGVVLSADSISAGTWTYRSGVLTHGNTGWKLEAVTSGTNLTVTGISEWPSLPSLALPLGDAVSGGYRIAGIGDGAFHGCINVTDVTFPSGMTVIGDGAFARCNGLTDVALQEGVAVIGKEAFAGCDHLTSVMLPDGVAVIGKDAFASCHRLTKRDVFRRRCHHR